MAVAGQVIQRENLQELIELGLTNKEMSERLGVSERKLRSIRKDYGLLKKDCFSRINNDELDEALIALIGKHPHFGAKMVQGALRSKNIIVQRDRIREAMRRVDPDGVDGRRRVALHRRQYRVPGPNYVWHIDGNHKLIRWRFVIHGGIDGYSRLPVYLKCATNNRATTVYSAFKEGVLDFGLPQKVRSDKGGENTVVCSFMLNHPLRGPERRAFITGRSVHNQRIERFWRDVFTGCTITFYRLFYQMEEMGSLNHAEEVDLAALHYVFLPIIQDRLEKFRQSFMWHKIRTEGNKTPLQLWQLPVNDGYVIDIATEDDFHAFGGGLVANQYPAVNVPDGLQLTIQQKEMLEHQFDLRVTELEKEEDQLNYYNGLKEFLTELTNEQGQ